LFFLSLPFSSHPVPQAARALAAGLPREDHVYITTDESVRFNNNKNEEKRGEKK